jgi:hypothetical protein
MVCLAHTSSHFGLGVLAMNEPMIIYDYDPFNLPPGILEAIGLAVTSAAQSESVLDMAIGGCLGIESPQTLALTTHMAIPLKFSVLKSVAEFKLEVDDLDALDMLLADLNTAFGKRNKYAHDSWCRHPTNGKVLRQTQEARIRLEMDLKVATVDEIKTDAKFIYDAGMALIVFLGDRDLLPAHSKTSPVREHKSPAARKKRRKAAGKS